jgi:hypothetical protein
MVAATRLYQQHGLAIMPLYSLNESGACTCGKADCPSPGKHPLLNGGCNAPLTPEQVASFFNPDFSCTYNVGISTGPSNLVVIDIDPRHGGDESLSALETMLGKLPATVTGETGGGGRHLLFAKPPAGRFTSTANIGKDLLGKEGNTGVDIRAEGGLIVAPPSLHKSGRFYRWKPGAGVGDMPPAQLPEAWRDYLDATPRQQVAATPHDMQASDYAKAKAACAFLAHAETNAASITEGEWFAQASNVVRCVDGERIFTEISMQYPGAQAQQIAQKIQRSKAFGKPHTCSHIEQEVGFSGCSACPNKGKVKVPVQLGRLNREELAAAAVATFKAKLGSVADPDGIAALVEAVPDLGLCNKDAIKTLWEDLSAAKHPAAKIVADAIANAVVQRRTEDLKNEALKQGKIIYAKGAETSAFYSDMVVERLAESDPPLLFHRDGVLVRVLPPPKDGAGYRMEEMSQSDKLRTAITRKTPFVIIEDGRTKQVDPPEPVMSDLLNRNDYPGVPYLRGIRRSPIFREDCTFCIQPGYDAQSEYYYDPPKDIAKLTIPDSPTADEVVDARAIIEDLLHDFPVKPGDCSRTHMVASLFTLVMRAAIPGPVPLVVIEAPYRGSGKTLLARVAPKTVLGMDPPAVAIADSDDEIRKSILAMHLNSPEYLLFDNVVTSQSAWNPQPLQALLTSGKVSDRQLGASTMRTVESRALIVVTGNKLMLGDDLARRSIYIQLHPQTDQPAQRDPSTFKYPDIMAYIDANRPKLLGALLTMIQGWVQAGKPPAKRVSMASFEHWASMVGGVLEFAGYTDFLANTALMSSRGGTEHRQWTRFVAALFRCFQTEQGKKGRGGFLAFTNNCPKLDEWASTREFVASDIPTALQLEMIGDDIYPMCFRRDLDANGRKLTSALGAKMKNMDDMRFGPLVIHARECSRNAVFRYQIVAADMSDPRILQEIYDMVMTGGERPIFQPGGTVIGSHGAGTLANPAVAADQSGSSAAA